MAETEERTQEVLGPICQTGAVPVVTGFIGATREGVTTTLGRGGSDLSATIIGRAISADEVWIWTDVTGVMTADPRIVPDAQVLPSLSYREVSELAYFGAKVLHPKAIRPIIDIGIPVRVFNTFAPDEPGTRIVSDSQEHKNGYMKAVTVVKEQCLITIEGRGMLGVPGVAARVFSTVAELNTSVSLISIASSEQSISFSISLSAADKVVSALNSTF
jgi:aspartate kinase